MKITTHIIKIILSGLILTTSVNYGQVELETVYLNNNAEETVYTNNFSNYNTNLIAENNINFRIEIKKAKSTNNHLLFLSERSNLEILTTSYLKTIRKGANRSSDAESFKKFLKVRLPELIHQFKKDNNLEELYTISRKNTFNGKIDALPSVL